jgi:ArsR family transcriptional regulator, arsenate/arsenite/antimonite-responsive transcriptional repressor
MTDIFDVVADETRREMLHILLESAASGSPEMSVSELVARTGLSQPTVSKQLKVLREVGVVGVREDGQHRLYHLDSAPLEELEDWVIPFLGIASPSTTGDIAQERVMASEAISQAGSSVGSVAASTVFQITQAFGGIQNSSKDAWSKASKKLRKNDRS